jgi:hypothetical protein
MRQPRRALVVGIDDYNNFPPLDGCVADAVAMAEVLGRNEDGSPNYDCRVLITGALFPLISRRMLRRHWLELFDGNFDGDALFYFSGHGTPTRTGGVLVTQDGETEDPGLFMSELVTLANHSQARSVLLILDCCYSGSIGDLPSARSEGNLSNLAQVREGVTILAASRAKQKAMEMDGHGVFTRLVLGALRGGAADLKGHVSAAAVYAYTEQILGDWQQRPLYKSHASSLTPIRTCKPALDIALLRGLPELFPEPESRVRLDRSFEVSQKKWARPENVEIFNQLKLLRNANLLATEDGEDLYFVALHEKTVRLTPLGQFYWELATRNKI